MNVRFIEACLDEIEKAVQWYAGQSPELPERAVEKFSPFPKVFHMVTAPYRRVRLSKSPTRYFSGSIRLRS
jgi:hypothetical protein